MTQRERQGWLIVASLWVTLFIIFGGGYLTAGVFFTPLLKQFGRGRAQLSTLLMGQPSQALRRTRSWRVYAALKLLDVRFSC